MTVQEIEKELGADLCRVQPTDWEIGPYDTQKRPHKNTSSECPDPSILISELGKDSHIYCYLAEKIQKNLPKLTSGLIKDPISSKNLIDCLEKIIRSSKDVSLISCLTHARLSSYKNEEQPGDCERKEIFEKVGLKHIYSLEAEKAKYEYELSKLNDQMFGDSEPKFEESKGRIKDSLVPSSPVSEEKSHLSSEYRQISANALQKQGDCHIRYISEVSSDKPLDLPNSQAIKECYSEFEYENISEENKEEEKSLDGTSFDLDNYQSDYNSSQDDIDAQNFIEYLKDEEKSSNYCSNDDSDKNSPHLLVLKDHKDFKVYESPWNIYKRYSKHYISPRKFLIVELEVKLGSQRYNQRDQIKLCNVSFFDEDSGDQKCPFIPEINTLIDMTKYEENDRALVEMLDALVVHYKNPSSRR
ncbi:unnamed protein product [Moneuplotes crassus]|uniref:Uncharacterized protein n=1 Tax=Euplotes crassus TaxID=5936 RepID=A0AAD1X7G0_EUPCR|nr:unnamed protein product [Moneuplotes crassus]